MIINTTYDSTVTGASNAAQIETAIVAATAFYEHAFRNTGVALNLDFMFGTLPANVLASNNGSAFEYSYSAVAAALKLSSHSADDGTAYATLPVSDPTTGTGTDFGVTRGEAEALGLSVGPATFDSTTTLGSIGFTFTYDPNARAVVGQYDAIGTLEHEISEFALGRIGAMGTYIFGGGGLWTPDDLFRYSAAGTPQLAPASGVPGYFSIDGTHLLQEYNNPILGGDAVDWLPSIQGDSYGDGYTDQVGAVSATDLRVLDVLGWTRTPATVADFNGDAVSDILFYNTTTGDLGYFEMQGSNTGYHSIGGSSTAFTVAGIGDFNGDYTDDILMRNTTTGALGFFSMSNGGTGSGSGPTQGNTAAGTLSGWHDLGGSSTAYAVVGVADFYGNGTDDILFRNNANGALGFFSVSAGVNTGWHDLGGSSTAYVVAGVADFYGNGTDDILFRNNTTGAMGFFSVSNGANTGWHDMGGSSAAYAVVGVGDFYATGNTNAHGTDDILFRNNTTGAMGFFAVSNGVVTGWHDLGGSSTAYSVVAVGDYYGNGSDDILFRNATNGDVGYFSISNGVNTGWHDVGVSSTAFEVPILGTAPIA
jgi:hypothetical protein